MTDTRDNLVILVNEKDEELGTCEKLEAHKTGTLHRAFSVLIFNSKHELLLQQRSDEKYHSPGLWTNTCCSHPRPGEKTHAAANRRLLEEMGMTVELEHRFHFVYRAEVGKQLIEHELDHVFVGFSETRPKPNPEEVKNYQWVSWQKLIEQIQEDDSIFTAWFKILIEHHSGHIIKALVEHESL